MQFGYIIENMQTIDEALEKLKHSRFRSSFHLGQRELAYTKAKGLDVIRSHADFFVQTRLAPAVIPNDGKQTPMHGHPVFIAQHATGCCCRGCLYKWYRVPKNAALTAQQQKKIVNLIMTWIEKEIDEQKKI